MSAFRRVAVVALLVVLAQPSQAQRRTGGATLSDDGLSAERRPSVVSLDTRRQIGERVEIRGRRGGAMRVVSSCRPDGVIAYALADDPSGRSGCVEREMAARSPIQAAWAGAFAGDTSDDHPPLVAALRAARGRGVVLETGRYALGARVHAAGSVEIVGRGSGATTLAKRHGSNGLRIDAPTHFSGSVSRATATTVTVRGRSGWRAGSLAGMWLRVPGASGSAQTVRIASNTATTITTLHALDSVPRPGQPMSVIRPIPSVVLRGFTLDGGSRSSAGIVINYADRVIVEDVRVVSNGGNGISVYGAGGGHITRSESSNNNFGIFVYNSDQFTVERSTARNNSGGYQMQIKDSRNSALVGNSVSGGLVGQNIKASGLHATFDVSIRGGTAVGTDRAGFNILALVNEGSRYPAVGYSISGVETMRCQVGVQIVSGPGASVSGARISQATITESKGIGVAISANGGEVSDVVVRRGAIRQLQIVGNDNRVLRSRFVDGNWRGRSNGPEVRVEGSGNVLRDNVFARSSAASRSVRVLQERRGSNRNRIIDSVLDDASAPYVADVIVGRETVVNHRR